MKTEEITITALDSGSFSAYLALPDITPCPGLVVIQEILGVNSVMRQIADAYAAAGYLVVVPDLFWRQEPGLQLSDKVEAEWAKAFDLYEGFNEDKGVEDLIATLDTLKNHPCCTGKVGSVGFCLGGKLAYLMGTRSAADCNVSYYGVAIENNLKEASDIQKPLMLHIAEQDQFVPPEAQAKIKAGLIDHPWVTIHTYPGVSHAFARADSQSYHPESAELASRRTLEFLQKHLS